MNSKHKVLDSKPTSLKTNSHLKRTTTNSSGKKNKHSTTNSNHKVLDSKPAAVLKTNSHLKRKFQKKTLKKNTMDSQAKLLSSNSQIDSTNSGDSLKPRCVPHHHIVTTSSDNTITKDKKDKTILKTKEKDEIKVIKEVNGTESISTSTPSKDNVQVEQDNGNYIFKGNYKIDKLFIDPVYNNEPKSDQGSLSNSLPTINSIEQKLGNLTLPTNLTDFAQIPGAVFFLFIIIFVLLSIIIIMCISCCLLISYFNIVFAIHHFKSYFPGENREVIEDKINIEMSNTADYVKVD